jgi:aspartyl/asparaginyl-tRNA synthetase
MDEGRARILALFCSVLGIAFLFVASSWIEQYSEPSMISGLSLDDVGYGIKVCGNATDVRSSKGNIFFGITDGTGTLNSVIFSNILHGNTTGLENNMPICATGELEEYPPGSGSLEIIVKKVVL